MTEIRNDPWKASLTVDCVWVNIMIPKAGSYLLPCYALNQRQETTLHPEILIDFDSVYLSVSLKNTCEFKILLEDVQWNQKK